MQKPSKTPSSKTGEQSTLIQKIISAPDRIPSVYYYSPLTVRVCIFVKKILEFIFLLLFTYLLLPPFLVWLFPNLVLKTEPIVFWKMAALDLPVGYDSTSVQAAGAGVQLSFDTINNLNDDTQIFLIVDSERIRSHLKKEANHKQVFCRPIPYHNRRFTFQEYVSMIKVCYLWLRMRNTKMKIIGFGKGTVANVLLEAAIQLYPKYKFSSINLEDPILDYSDLYKNNNWVKWMFPIPQIRYHIIDYVLQKYDLTFTSLSQDILKLNSKNEKPIHLYMSDGDGMLNGELEQITSEFKYVQQEYERQL